MKIRKFNDMNESVGSKVITYKTKDILPLVKLINIDKEDFEDISEFYYYEKEKDRMEPTIFNGDEYKCVGIYSNCELGFLVFKNEEPEYIISIYEPHGSSINKRGLVTAWGHKEIIKLWLDDGRFFNYFKVL